MVHLTVCYYHVMCEFQSESTLYSCLNVKDLLVKELLIHFPVRLNGWVFIYILSGCGFESCCCCLNFSYGTCFEQGVSCIQATIECRFTLKLARDMIVTYSQMHCTDKYSQQLNHLASLGKLLSVRLQTKWLWVWIPLLSLQLHIWRLFQTKSSLTFSHL